MRTPGWFVPAAAAGIGLGAIGGVLLVAAVTALIGWLIAPPRLDDALFFAVVAALGGGMAGFGGVCLIAEGRS